MTWLVALLLIIAFVALAYKIYYQVQVQIIEKKKLSPLFWITLSFMCFLPVFRSLKNTSATILATKANAGLCIFYSCVIAVFLFDVA